ncbi:MAG: ABC transporter permease [Treponema sp.]|nr:ABC transporter permease [Treponema sp.]
MTGIRSGKQLMVIPYAFWALFLVIIPILLIIYYSFSVEIDGELFFSLANYKKAFEPVYLNVLQRSISLALSCTAICLLLGYPVAYILASKEYEHTNFLLFMFLVPMWMNFLLRTYSWLSILEKNGFLNIFLEFIGLPKMSLLYNNSAVLFGMVYNYLPFMILPIYSVMKKMDPGLVEAAQDLGANSWIFFFKLELPLSIPGVISGITMVFMPAVTTFIISDLLGGAQFMLIGNLIEHQFLKVNDWHFGSAISVILMTLLLISFWIFSMVDKGTEERALF